MSCGCGKKKCNGKCGISPSVLQINNNECTLFHKVEIPAVMGDETTNPPKTGAYRNVLLYYEASGNSYLYSSDGIPTKLTGVVSDYEVLTNKPSINGVVLIKNKTLADLGIISAIDSAVADEATARTNADNALSDRITTNANNIAANATAISNEVTARTNADNTLSARISGNTTAINNEKTARENADTALSNRITANANAISAETTARENVDNALSGRITANADAISGEKTARENADAGLQDQITAVKATADSAVQPDDIDKTVMSDLAVDSNSSTAQVILKESKVNLKTGATSSEQTSLPVASSSQAGVMNSATYDAVTSNTSNINAIMNGAVAITGLPANPSQSDLTTAWQNETGLSTLINRASVYDVTNNKVWTYYTNDTTWHAASNTSSVTVNTFTNSSEGTIKGSTNIGQVFAENDGTGSVNGWDALSDAVSNNTSKLAGIESGAEVNVQSDWNVSDSSSDAYIKNKPTIGNGTLTIQKNGTTIDTFTANSTTNKTVNITVPTVNDATLTIQKNGDTVQTFTANSSSNKTANIEVPTKTSELDNDAGFIANDTHQVCGEGGNIALDTTTFEPLEMNHLGGNTSQQTYTGKNLIPFVAPTTNTRGLTVTADISSGAITFGGTTNAGYPWVVQATGLSLPAGTYTFSIDHALPYTLSLRLYETSSSYPKTAAIQAGQTSATVTTTYTITQVVGLYGASTSGIVVSNTTIYPQFESGSSATSFEKFVGGTPAPNPDYPQTVQTVTGEQTITICGKNLFDKNNASEILNGYIDTAFHASNSMRTVYVPCEPNTAYTVSKMASSRFIVATATEVPAGGVQVSGAIQNNTATSITITTGATAKYLVAYIYHSSYDTTVTPEQIIATLQIEKGSPATAYEPYQEQNYEVNLGKNLFNPAIAAHPSGMPNNLGETLRVDTNTTYTFNVGNDRSFAQVQLFDNTGTRTRTLGNGVSDHTLTFTTTASEVTGLFCFYPGQAGVDPTTYDYTGVQLEKGSQATSYAAYFEPIELCKIGDYQDSIYKSGDKWYVHKETGKRTYTADDITIAASDTYSNVRYAQFPKGADNKQNGNYTYGGIINFFTHGINMGATPAGGWNSYISDGLIYNSAMQDNYWCSFSKSTTLATMKEKLNGMVAYYVLATPTDTEITNEALVAQLEALWEADGYDGQTNITLTYAEGNAQGILSVCQYPSHLPVATKSKLGTIIVGHGLDIEDDGRLDVIVDSALSDSSINPVQNKAITTELNSKADISSVPTKTSQLENDSGFVVNDTTEICDEGSDITLNGTLLEPLDVKKIEGATSQQTYSGKNLINLTGVTSPAGVTGTITDGSTIKVTGTTGTNVTNNKVADLSSTIPAGTYTFTIDHAASHVINFTANNSDGDVAFRLAPGETSVTKTLTSASTAGQVFWGLLANTTYNETFKLQLVAGSTPDYNFEPYVGGVPAPNPDYPQAVNTVTGENVVDICGKNLLDSSSYSDGYINNSGAVVSGGGLNALFGYISVSPSTSYTISASSSTRFSAAFYNGETYISRDNNHDGTSYTFTTPNNCNRIRCWVWRQSGVDQSYINSLNLQLELGSSASSFEPYQEQSYPISLGSIELCNIPGTDYRDRFTPRDGKWYVHKEVGKAVLDGSEANWATQTSGGLKRYSVNRTDSKSFSGRTSDVLLSSHFTPSTTDAVGIFFVAAQTYYFYPDQSIATLDSWKSWLASNNVALYYPLATPTDTEITNEALIAQLNALADADGVEGETNIFTASDGVNERAILSVCQYPSHLPIATKTKLGTVVVGHGLDIEADGKLDVIVDDDFSTESDHPVQNKVITNALAGKADNTDLSTVAMTGSYDDLTGKPTIPTVNNATLTIQKNGTNVATFTANSSTNVTANITAPVVTMTTTDPGEGGALAANNFIGVYV